MPLPGAAVPLTFGETVTIIGPIQPGANSWMVEVENLSPWTLTVVMPGQAGTNLAPGMGQLYQAKTGPATLQLTPIGTPVAGTYQVVTNWAQGNDTIPGTFPVVVAPSLSSGAPSGVAQYIGTEEIPPNSFLNVTYNLNPDVTFIVVFLGPPVSADVMTVIGVQSSVEAIGVGTSVASPFLAAMGGAIVPGLDTQIAVDYVNNSATKTQILHIVGYSVFPEGVLSRYVSIPASLSLAASGSGTLIPSPAGTFIRVDYLSMLQVTAAVTATVTGVLSGSIYAQYTLEPAGANLPPPLLPFSVPALNEGLKITVGAASGLLTYTAYTPIPIYYL
jgi:hypothetical protein